MPGSSIYRKIHEIMQSIARVEKDAEIKLKSGEGYKVTTYDSVLDAVRPLLLEKKLILVRTGANVTLIGNIAIGEFKYKLIDTETDEAVELASIGSGHDLSDKHTGKAMTYALKYLLRDTFLIRSSREDDPDTGSSERNAERDLASRLSTATLNGLVDDAVKAGKMTASMADTLKNAFIPIDGNRAELEKAREYLKNTYGV